ncbi:MAG: excinuclease ABC subunit UvrC [Pseudomonadota bacterium]
MADPQAVFDAADFLNTLTSKPGVYRMLGMDDKILYVGKARNLKKRVSSYFRKTGLNAKTRALVGQIKHIEVTVTHTEGEALLLENNLIKQHRPRYNVLLRDDKSYPYIYLSSDQQFPRLSCYRGARRGKGRYFGPYPGAGAVRESLHLLQRLFRVRQCEDSFFRNRTRPCLQYQIKRCTAPCVGYISAADYAEDVNNTVMFLEGKSSAVIDGLVKKMEQASADLDYEQAAEFRNQIANLHRVQEKQYVSNERGDLDIVACASDKGNACIQVFFIRSGRNLGNAVFYPGNPSESRSEDVLSAFLPQYYLGKDIPAELLLSHKPDDIDLLQEVLSEQAAHKVKLSSSVRGDRARWLKLARNNAEQALASWLNTRKGYAGRLRELQAALKLTELPERMECFDISHTRGEATVASCVVFGMEGPLKSDYRRFNIENIQAGDDYAAMEQALTRRYTRLMKGEGKLPDLLFIDGGKGQISSAASVLEELQVTGVRIIGVAKGPDRKPGLETLYIAGDGQELHLSADAPALHLIQQIRDEAHRFAITGHRQRRAKTRRTSVLEGIPGVGPRRRQQLLKQFGGLQEVARAGIDDLVRVKGINRALAQQIYDALHND